MPITDSIKYCVGTSADYRTKPFLRQNISFENVTKFKYLRMTITNQISFHEEIKSRLNSGNTRYHAVQTLLSSHQPLEP
jgi:hypothetical protein